MRIVNAVVYILMSILCVLWIRGMKGHGALPKVVDYLRKRWHLVAGLFVINTISFCLTFAGGDKPLSVERDGSAGSERQLALWLMQGGEQEKYDLTIYPIRLTERQQKEQMNEAFRYLETHMLGENTSQDRVEASLDFSLDYQSYPFDIEIRPEHYSLMDEEGNIKNQEEELLEAGYKNEDLERGISTGFTISLWYGETYMERAYKIRIFPKQKEGAEQLFSVVKKQLEDWEQETIYDKEITLPQSIEGVQIKAAQADSINAVSVFVFGLVVMGLFVLREKEGEAQDKRKRQEQLRRCYPWFVNELVLLLGAGMQVKNIFSVMLQEYEEKDDFKEPLIKELMEAQNSFRLGVSESQIYYQLGRRLELPCYIRLMTLLEQNVKRGTKGLMLLFEQEELAALEERKTLARRYGEEAGTKLLGPMMLLLLVVMLMIMIPAFIAL